MQKVNLEKLQQEAKERHKHRQRKPYTKKTLFEKTLEQEAKATKEQRKLNHSILYP